VAAKFHRARDTKLNRDVASTPSVPAVLQRVWQKLRSDFALSELRRDSLRVKAKLASWYVGAKRRPSRSSPEGRAKGWLGVRDDFRNWLIHAI
jgi:hypothetical protein